MTSLAIAIMEESLEVVDVLLIGGAKMEGTGLLEHTIEHQMGRITSVLLRHRATSNIEDGWSAVRFVLEKLRGPYCSHWMGMFLRFKDGGVDLDEVYQGKPLLCWEVIHQQDLYQHLGEYNLFDTVFLLANHGADIDQATDDGETALMIACKITAIDQRRSIIGELLECGADPDVPNRYGQTAL